MMYTFQSRIRYSETDEDGRLRLNALINYFQDCSTFHSEDCGIGLEWLKQRNRVWVLNSWQILIDRYPDLGENVLIGTSPYDFRGMFGYRNFWMTDDQGRYLARANSIWVLLDTESGRPVKVQPEDVEPYGNDKPLVMPEMGRKIRLPEGGEKQEPIIVRPYQLDTNHHVNNGQYVEMARDCIPPGFQVQELQAEYRKQAVLGDELTPRVQKNENGWIVSLENGEGLPYAIVKLLGGHGE